MEFFTIEGIIFVSVAWGIVIALLGWSLFKVFRTGTNLKKLARQKKLEMEQEQQ
jgi:hypothetical protein